MLSFLSLSRRVSPARRRDALLATLARLHRLPGGAPVARAVERRVVERLARDLFDADAYGGTFEHWLRHAGASDRGPNRWFDPEHYRAQVRRWPRGLNPLVHWALRGRHRGLSPWPDFDPTGYLAANPDVAVAKVDPYRHFALHGAAEGRPAGAGRVGSGEGVWASDGLAASVEDILVEDHRPPAEPLVDVVVPVHGDAALTLACLRNALRPSGVPHAVVVVDDATPEPALARALDRLSEAGLVTLLRNTANRGFVASVNRGIARRADRDVVLLNADALVFGDWLARMRRAADEGVASVTPLTNSGTICSYPRPNRDNGESLELPYDSLDALAAEVNAGEAVAAPVGVGFCMLMTRRALDAVGPLDEAAFGAGYGEEADWCQRAGAQGFRNLVATDIVVLHVGGTSFGATRAERVRAADRVLEARWPRYVADVAAFTAADPLRPARERLDAARLRRGCAGDAVLLVTHGRGGGIEQCVQESAAAHGAAGRDVLRLHADAADRPALAREGADTPNLPSLEWDALAPTLRELGVRQAELHSLADFDVQAPARLLTSLEDAAVPFAVHLHDYLPICPRINLADERGLYCGEPDEAGCQACLGARGSAFGAPDILAWRVRYHALLRAADAVVAPDDDVARRVRARWSDLAVTVRPHESVAQAALPAGWAGDRPFRVAVIGSLTPIKGLHVLRACARAAAAEGLPVEFVVVGATSDDAASRAAGLLVTGPYTNDHAAERLAATGAQAAFVASTWPETFAFTMSHALRSGLPLVTFDLGAQAARLPRDPRNLALPLALAERPAELCAGIIAHLEGFARTRRSRETVSASDRAASASDGTVSADGRAAPAVTRFVQGWVGKDGTMVNEPAAHASVGPTR